MAKSDMFKCAHCRVDFYLADYNIPDEIYVLDDVEFRQICDGTHKSHGILCADCYDALNKVLPFEDDDTLIKGTVH